MSSKPTDKAAPGRTSAKGRQDGDYTAPVLAEPSGGPIPAYRPISDEPKKKAAAAKEV